MSSSNNSSDPATSFAAIHMISQNAVQADRFQLIPSLAAHMLHLPWMSISIIRSTPAASTTVAESCFPEESSPVPPDIAAWTARAIVQLDSGGLPVIITDRIVEDARQRWILCPIDDQTFTLTRFALAQSATPDLLDLLETLTAHAARVVAASLFWCEDPANLGEPLNRLTPREWDVLKAIHTADPEKLIADRLAVSPHTFHVHIKRIYRKLNVRSRLSLIELCRDIERERLVAAVAPAAQAVPLLQQLCPA